MNFTQVAGHLGADPEERFTPSGQKVTTLRIATHSRKGGKDVTIWWKLTIWGDRFEKMMPYLKKGSPIIAMGEMNKPEIYTNKEGHPQVSLELVVSDLRFSPFGKGDKGSENTRAEQSTGKPEPHTTSYEPSEDEIPF